jgi:dolichol kinase
MSVAHKDIEAGVPVLWSFWVILLFSCQMMAICSTTNLFTALVTAFHLALKSCRMGVRSDTLFSSDINLFRLPCRQGCRGDDGASASIVLVPVLLQAMACYDQHWSVYPNIATAGLVMFWNVPVRSLPFVSTLLFGVVIFFFWAGWMSLGKGIIFFCCWVGPFLSLRKAPSLHRVFTVGEWAIVTSLLAVAFTEMVCLNISPEKEYIYRLVSLSGLIGSIAVFCSVHMLARQRLPLRLAYIAALPLLFVECTLTLHAKNATADLRFPKCIFWLWQFLLEREQPMAPYFHLVPRFYWLLYWAVTLLILMFLAPDGSKNPVVARKWFHFIAVLLFGPVTVAAPQLQSMSFAIAASLLLVVECIRSNCPCVNMFYQKYLDTAKGEGESSEQIVVSHLALILGCAAPLWVAECVGLGNENQSFRLVTSLWGVITLGIGDAMGAVIGTSCGRLRWGHNRTVEGSLAMFLSMQYACSRLSVEIERDAMSYLWTSAIAMVTVLEAFTLQLDNLILPLAGVAVVLLMNIVLQKASTA